MNRPASTIRRLTRYRLGLVLAALVGLMSYSASFTGANYTARTSNPSNVATAGTLSLSSSNTAQLLTATSWKPGVSRNATLTLTNTGNVTANVVLRLTNVTNTPSNTSIPAALDATVDDVTGTPANLCTAKLSTFAATPCSLGALAAGASKSIKLTLAWPSANPDATLQAASTSFTLSWEATS